MTNIYYKNLIEDESTSIDSFLIYISGIGIYLSKNDDLLRIMERDNGYSIDDISIDSYAESKGYHIVFRSVKDNDVTNKEWYTEFKDNELMQQHLRNNMKELAKTAKNKTRGLNFQDRLVHHLILELVSI